MAVDHDRAPARYTGRFAPSPTGPLHFGSLVGALASYLDAKAHGGQWLVRMEDLDPPREVPGAADAILQSLITHGLHWDQPVLYQSRRDHAYGRALDTLIREQLAYPCRCTRKQVIAMGGVYDGTCRQPVPAIAADEPVAWRLKVSDLPSRYAAPDNRISFTDLFFGPQTQDLSKEVGDFIVRRKDQLFAYQLAVVVDDIEQGITHVIRGSDLLDSTAQQIFLFRLLGAAEPYYGHHPVALNEREQKLSKQHHAPAIDDARPTDNLHRALILLNHSPPDSVVEQGVDSLLAWGVQHWRREAVPVVMGIAAD